MLLYSVLRGRIFKARAKQDISKGGGGVEVCSPKKLLILHTYPDPLQPRHRVWSDEWQAYQEVQTFTNLTTHKSAKFYLFQGEK